MSRYCFKWLDTSLPKHKREGRVFTFEMKDVPEKYRASVETAKEWARRVLSNKYDIPEKEIYFRGWGIMK
jgi:hypothetical protein